MQATLQSTAADAGLQSALQLMRANTVRFDGWELMGPRNAAIRAQIMSALMGCKMPQAKSGVSAIRSELWRRAALAGCEFQTNSCIAANERTFEAWAISQVGEASGRGWY
jgi:hypothetical protein